MCWWWFAFNLCLTVFICFAGRLYTVQCAYLLKWFLCFTEWTIFTYLSNAIIPMKPNAVLPRIYKNMSLKKTVQRTLPQVPVKPTPNSPSLKEYSKRPRNWPENRCTRERRGERFLYDICVSRDWTEPRRPVHLPGSQWPLPRLLMRGRQRIECSHRRPYHYREWRWYRRQNWWRCYPPGLRIEWKCVVLPFWRRAYYSRSVWIW